MKKLKLNEFNDKFIILNHQSISMSSKIKEASLLISKSEIDTQIILTKKILLHFLNTYPREFIHCSTDEIIKNLPSYKIALPIREELNKHYQIIKDEFKDNESIKNHILNDTLNYKSLQSGIRNFLFSNNKLYSLAPLECVESQIVDNLNSDNSNLFNQISLVQYQYKLNEFIYGVHDFSKKMKNAGKLLNKILVNKNFSQNFYKFSSFDEMLLSQEYKVLEEAIPMLSYLDNGKIFMKFIKILSKDKNTSLIPHLKDILLIKFKTHINSFYQASALGQTISSLYEEVVDLDIFAATNLSIKEQNSQKNKNSYIVDYLNLWKEIFFITENSQIHNKFTDNYAAISQAYLDAKKSLSDSNFTFFSKDLSNISYLQFISKELLKSFIESFDGCTLIEDNIKHQFIVSNLPDKIFSQSESLLNRMFKTTPEFIKFIAHSHCFSKKDENGKFYISSEDSNKFTSELNKFMDSSYIAESFLELHMKNDITSSSQSKARIVRKF